MVKELQAKFDQPEMFGVKPSEAAIEVFKK
jgi:hypothetical protein